MKYCPLSEVAAVMQVKTIHLMLATCWLAGCATGSAIVVGDTRPATENWESVVVTKEMPAGAEEIAVVKAASNCGFTNQQHIDFAMSELKKQAAKVGANTIVIAATSTGESIVGIPSYNADTQLGIQYYPIDKEVLEGIAVFVKR